MTTSEHLLNEYSQALAEYVGAHASGNPNSQAETRFKAARIALLAVLRADAVIVQAAQAEVTNFDATRGLLQGVMDGTAEGASLEVLQRQGELMVVLRDATRTRQSTIESGPALILSEMAPPKEPMMEAARVIHQIPKISLAAQAVLRAEGNTLTIG